MRKPIIAITMGDPGGVGPETLIKAFHEVDISSDDFHYLVIGVREVFEVIEEEYNLSLPFHFLETFDEERLESKKINFLDVTPAACSLYDGLKDSEKSGDFTFKVGQVSAANACMAYASIKTAANYAHDGAVDAIVTAPLNKTSIRIVDPHFDGHTDFLAKVAGVEKYAMMFVHEKLKVTLTTIHVALKKVSALINEKLVYEKIRLTDRFLKTYFNISKPKLAVCALNPHGNETGTEDDKHILPAVNKAQEKNMNVVGPLAADQLFYEAYKGRYDALISMYHDQGLAPFKMIAFKDGVNVTLGLPFVRTSPDHGTAFDIAYQNKANSDSMEAAIRLAEKLLALSAPLEIPGT